MNDTRSLRALQSAFADMLVDGGREPAPGLVRANGLSARQRLNVYYHHSQIVHLDALQSIYPALRRLVGDSFFAELAVLYGRQFPIHSGDLRTFGADLPRFIDGFEPLSSLPYLADVARLEWACHESLHAGESVEPVSLGALIPLQLAAHVHLPCSAYPVAQIWEFALSDQGPEGPRLNIEGAGPDYLLVMRPQLDVEVYALSAEDWAWLTRFAVTVEGGCVPEREELPRCREWMRRGVLVPADIA